MRPFAASLLMPDLQPTIDSAWESRSGLAPDNAPAAIRDAVDHVIAELDAGRLRVAERVSGGWITHQWIKKAVLLSFRLADNAPMSFAGGAHGAAPLQFYDKVPTKFADYTPERFAASGVRVVPPATVRRGAYVAPNVVLMPSYVNIGAHVGEGTMVDTWATVGSCAQIGRNVHLSGGVGIGGVLEPLQANPTIIEDNCFIGARSEVVEGVIVEENSVLGMGVFIGQSTKIYNRATGETVYGRVPAGSVVVAGGLPSGEGRCNLYCAVIVKQVDAKTRAKTSINELLRA
jgi:2,3,4,5-tetrahydropyridine-2,6-dicarboxylate N-succinyltransferase